MSFLKDLHFYIVLTCRVFSLIVGAFSGFSITPDFWTYLSSSLWGGDFSKQLSPIIISISDIAS